jgi:hypothetical protein
VLIVLIHCKVVRCRYKEERGNTYVLFTPMEPCDSILLMIQRLTNDVYFDGTNYNDISVPVKGNLRFEFELPCESAVLNHLAITSFLHVVHGTVHMVLYMFKHLYTF